MRGSLGQSVKVVTIIGITPACAGTTGCGSTTDARPAIQPRVCGDYRVHLDLHRDESDTTPRVRGLRIGRITGLCPCRYNPACAGTTHGSGRAGRSSSIQPRVCGDYAIPAEKVARIADTTPRVRGLHLCRTSLQRRQRYNPACAGTTCIAIDGIVVLSIQPRVCGDYSYMIICESEK